MLNRLEASGEVNTMKQMVSQLEPIIGIAPPDERPTMQYVLQKLRKEIIDCPRRGSLSRKALPSAVGSPLISPSASVSDPRTSKRAGDTVHGLVREALKSRFANASHQ